MSEFELKKSKLENSPIISKSPGAKVSYGSQGKNDDDFKSPWLKRLVIPILVLVAGGLITFYMTKQNIEDSDNGPEISIQNSELQNSPVFNKSPGARVDYNLKADSIAVFADKEALGIRETLGLYRDGKKVGEVVNPAFSNEGKAFTFDRVDFDKPYMGNRKNSTVNLDYYDGPFEFDKYIIRVTQYETLTSSAMHDVSGEVITEIE